MDVVQVDGLDAQPLQAPLARLLAVFGRRIDRHAILGPLVGELGRQEDLVALAGPLEPPPNQVLRVLVHVGGIPEGLAQLVGAVEDLEALLVGLGGAVEGRDSHEPETQGGNLGAVLAQLAGGELRRHLCWYLLGIFVREG